MNWIALGAVAETVGVIAVLVSLVYLATQIKQANQEIKRSVKASQLSAFERNVASGNRVREMLLLNPELADLMMRGFADYPGLDREERFRFGLLMRNIFSEIQGAYIRQRSIEHDPMKFAGSNQVVDELIANPGVRQWLQRSRPDWHPDFQSLVTDRLREIAPTDAEQPPAQENNQTEDDE